MNQKLPPPYATRRPTVLDIHGTKLTDDFAWLREKDSPEALAYLQAENAYTAAAMEGTESLQRSLYAEILSHIQEDDESVPYTDNGWDYITRTRKGSQYTVYLRKPAGAPAAEYVTLLDVNALAEGEAFLAIGSIAVSPDGKRLAYTTDNTGFRQYTLHVLDLAGGELLGDTAQRVGSLVWTSDSAALFYTTEDEQTKRQDRAFRLSLGSPPIEVFYEPDERFNLELGRTRDRQYLLLESASHTTSETWYRSAGNVDGQSFRLFAQRMDDTEYQIDHRDGFWYVRTNHGQTPGQKAHNFRLMRAPQQGESEQDRGLWQEVLPELADTPLDDFDLFQDFLVASYRDRGLPILRVFAFDPQGLLADPQDIRFPDPAYEAHAEINRAFKATHFRYAYQSLVRPASVFAYDVAARSSTLLKQQHVPGGFEASRYASERLWFSAADGTQVPLSLVYRTDTFERNNASPLYLYGYGSYGYALPLGFSAARLALLDRGVVVAYAHVRGGGELGDPWHAAGKMMSKRNTFDDFIAATEFLIDERYVDPGRIAIEGGSAGGLLLGTVLNLRPDLYRAVLSHVPFVDVMNTMLDASLPLTVAEYEEWGNPNDPEAFAYMLSYSPYENLEALRGKRLPAVLVKTSLNDSQVMYWEPAKYVARLRGLKAANPEDSAPLLLHVNMDAGHGGASGRYDSLKELAFDFAFLLRELNLDSTGGGL